MRPFSVGCRLRVVRVNSRSLPGVSPLRLSVAVVINADIPSNLGCIVRVIETHDGSGPIRFDFEGKVWWVSCEHPMTWTLSGKTYRMKEGPVPDGRLQPIRGLPRKEESLLINTRAEVP